MRSIAFTKMQGAGNDFVVLDGISRPFDLSSEELKRLADRHLGVGCDQILVVEQASSSRNDFRYRIFNADGGEVEQCGNGARCFVRFVHDRHLSDKSTLRVETLAGVIELRLLPSGEVSVDMGVPSFASAEVPFLALSKELVQSLDLGGRTVEITALSMGNPHAVQVVSEVDAAPVLSEGPQIERHPRFPQRVNAGYMEIVTRSEVRLRVWERGVGETLACGTGACAAAVAGIARGLLDSPVRVAMRGGILTIEWRGPATPVVMTGPAAKVFDGTWDAPKAVTT